MTGFLSSVVIWALIATFIVGVAWLLDRRSRNIDRILHEKIVVVLEEHQTALVRKYRQLVYPNEYGISDMTKWHREIEYFIDTVIPISLSGVDFKLGEREIDGDINKYRPEIRNYIDEFVRNKLKSPTQDRERRPQTGVEYEVYCRDLLINAGWSASLTPASGDQGADIVANRDGVSLVLQCKLYSGSVGNKAVQEVAAARIYHRANHAAVISNAPYTPAAKSLAHANDVLLLHHTDLQNLYELVKRQAGHRGIACPNCHVVLRLPTGRRGTVRCPECASRFEADTRLSGSPNASEGSRTFY